LFNKRVTIFQQSFNNR